MSTLTEALKAELVSNTNTSSLLAGSSPGLDRVYPLVIPQKKPGVKQLPGVVYTRTAWAAGVSYCGTDELVMTTLRIDCYDVTYDGADELARAVRGALMDFRGNLGGTVEVRTANLETEFDVQDFEPGLFRVTQSWNFWHVE